MVDTSLLFKPYLGLGKPWTNHHDRPDLTGGRQVPIVPKMKAWEKVVAVCDSTREKEEEVRSRPKPTPANKVKRSSVRQDRRVRHKNTVPS